MPKLTSVASIQKKYEVDQGQVVGEQNFRKFAKFRKISKTVDFASVIHPTGCSFATEPSCSARNSVAHPLLHTRTHTHIAHTHPQMKIRTQRHTYGCAHTPNKSENSRNYRTMSKTVDSVRVIHSNACSFANEHSCPAHISVAHT